MAAKKSFLAIAVWVMVCFSGVAWAKTNLTCANYFPATHIASTLMESFCKEIETQTNGDIAIAYSAGGKVLKPTQMFEGVKKGVTDIGLSNLAYSPAQFPEMALCDLPLGMPSAWVASHVVNQFYNAYKPKEMDGVKVLFFFACGPNLISTTKTPVNTLADLKNQNLRATGRIGDTAKALGAQASSYAINETYKALQVGLITGVMLPMSTLKDFRFGEVVKHCTTNWQVGNVYTFYVVMNKEKWDLLPEKTQAVFEKVSKAYIDKMGTGWNRADLDSIEYFKAQSGQMIDLQATEAEKWVQKVEGVMENFCLEMEKKGLPADTCKERINFIRDRIKEMTQVQLDRGIPMPFGH